MSHQANTNIAEAKMDNRLPDLTSNDLDIILGAYEKKKVHYRAQVIIDPENKEYYDKHLKQLDQMEVAAMARFHNGRK